MEALYDFDDLDEYIDDHWHAFESYDPEGEQRLEWQTVHLEYVALVDPKVQEHLAPSERRPTGCTCSSARWRAATSAPRPSWSGCSVWATTTISAVRCAQAARSR